MNTLGSGVSTYTFMIGSAKGENEKSIRLIFDKASKESTMIIKRIDIRGVEDPDFPLKNVECDECPVVKTNELII